MNIKSFFAIALTVICAQTAFGDDYPVPGKCTIAGSRDYFTEPQTEQEIKNEYQSENVVIKTVAQLSNNESLVSVTSEVDDLSVSFFIKKGDLLTGIYNDDKGEYLKGSLKIEVLGARQIKFIRSAGGLEKFNEDRNYSVLVKLPSGDFVKGENMKVAIRLCNTAW